MTALTELDYDSTLDDLVRAVLYSFAMNDYDGEDSVALRSIAASDIFDDVKTEVVNEALATIQQAGLIAWNEEQIGRIGLTAVGIAKFQLVRNDFFDDEENELLRNRLVAINISDLQKSQTYQSLKRKFSGLAVLSGQMCPQSGRWQAQRLSHKTIAVEQGELLPYPKFDHAGNQVIWHLLLT
ncbi:hypothetical protein [Collimonas pratensis]|uniref:Uncharacterized protein n=1 Tax=Collimonas pratensis TaxID=279113 RepID=A0A127PZ03_9BURK|nr:hypothetical protein [Collimonas pratensis]AMP03019.1 hypothetical protein CPter91_0624 [Collimonas pratensis]